MAKRSYSIPYPLDSTYMDMEIAIQNNQGMGLRPMPIKNILLILTGVVSGVYLLMNTVIARGPMPLKVLFAAVWLGLCMTLLTYSRTKLLGVQRLLSLITYMNPDNRYVSTRAIDKANSMIRVAGWEYIDEDDVIHYADKSLGVVFDIIGNASILLFEDHRNAIIDQVDKHYQKMKPDVTYQFVTRKEPQNVYLQVGSMVERERKMTVEDQDLSMMFATNKYVLGHLVGQSFKSIHQYLIVQAKDKETLDLGLSVLLGEIENSSLMFKHAEQLDAEAVTALMTDIYGSRKEL